MFKRLIKSQAMRQRVSWLIAAVLILPFIFFFHATAFRPPAGPGGTAGVLFGKPVSWDTFERYYRMAQSRLESQYGELPEGLRPLIVQSTWDWLLLLEEAKRQRLRTGDAALRAAIEQEPVFQEAGRFQRDRYEQVLARNSLAPAQFEQQLREQLLVEQLIERFRASVHVSDDEVRAAYRRAHEQLTATLFVLNPEAFHKRAADVTDEAVRQHYDAHPEGVRVPEQLRVEYAGATRDALASKVQLSDQDLAAWYDEHRQEFAKADGTVPPLAEVREDIRKRLTAQRVERQLLALASDLEDDLGDQRPFDDIVKSRALLSRTAGPFSADHPPALEALEPEIIAAVSTLPEGRLSRVIHTASGLYLARVAERIPARVPPFDEVKAQVRTQLIESRARQAAQQAAEALAAKLAEAAATHTPQAEVARAAGAPAPTTVTFTRAGLIPPLGLAPEVNTAAFATPLGQWTNVLETPRGYVLLRPDALTPADDSGFAAEATTLRETTLADIQVRRWRDWLQELRQQAKLQSFVEQPLPAAEPPGR